MDRARAAGELRADVTVADVLLVIATAAPSLPDAAQQAAASARLLDILLEGLRSRPGVRAWAARRATAARSGGRVRTRTVRDRDRAGWCRVTAFGSVARRQVQAGGGGVGPARVVRVCVRRARQLPASGETRCSLPVRVMASARCTEVAPDEWLTGTERWSSDHALWHSCPVFGSEWRYGGFPR